MGRGQKRHERGINLVWSGPMVTSFPLSRHFCVNHSLNLDSIERKSYTVDSIAAASLSGTHSCWRWSAQSAAVEDEEDIMDEECANRVPLCSATDAKCYIFLTATKTFKIASNHCQPMVATNSLSSRNSLDKHTATSISGISSWILFHYITFYYSF